MKRLVVIGTVIGALTFASGATATAQPGMGRGAGRQGARMYDPKTVETLRGTVLKIEQIAGRGKGRSGGIHLLLKTDKEEVAVHLGPAWYIDQQPVKIAVQDSIEVRGSRVTFEGKPAIIAAEVKRGDQVLKLRDDSGVPAWSGRGRKR